MADDVMFPIMIPTISSIRLLLMIVENRSIIPITNMEPINAAVIIKNEELSSLNDALFVKNDVMKLLPPASITIATPKFAPLLIPSIDGPASGLLNTVCSISPLTANDAPQSNAVIADGKREFSIIYV